PVHHDLGHGLVTEEIVDRPVPCGLGEDGLLQSDAVGAAEKESFLVERRGDMLREQKTDRLRPSGLEARTDDRGYSSVNARDELDLLAVSQPAQSDRAWSVGLEGEAHPARIRST